MGARLRVGGDPARVVVGSAGYQAWAENVGKPRPVRLLDLTGSRTIVIAVKSRAPLPSLW